MTKQKKPQVDQTALEEEILKEAGLMDDVENTKVESQKPVEEAKTKETVQEVILKEAGLINDVETSEVESQKPVEEAKAEETVQEVVDKPRRRADHIIKFKGRYYHAGDVLPDDYR